MKIAVINNVRYFVFSRSFLLTSLEPHPIVYFTEVLFDNGVLKTVYKSDIVEYIYNRSNGGNV